MPKLNVEVLGDSSSLVKAFGRARSSARGFEHDIGKAGRGTLAGTGAMRGLGRSVAFASASFLGGAGLGFAVKSSISASINLGKQMALLQTQAGASAREVDVMTKAVERLGPAVGFAPEELAKGLFHVESAGFRGAKALSVLKTAAQGAKVGNADLEATTTALVAAQQSGIRGTENIRKAMGGLNAIVGAGNLRMEDLTSALSTGILPSARAAGVSLTDVGAALATLTNAGVPAQAAATRLRMTFSLLGTQTPAAAKALRSIGIRANELGESLRKRGLVPTLELLQERLKQSGLSATRQASVISKAFGGGRSASTLITLLQNLDGVRKRQDQIAKGSGKFGAAWERTQKTAAFATDRLKASISVLETTLGAALVPSVTKAAKAMSDWLGKEKNQEALQRGLHQVIGAVSTVLHGLVAVVKVADKVTGSFKNTIIALTAAFVAFKAVRLGTSIAGFGGSLVGATAKTAGFTKAFVSLARTEGIIGTLSASFPKLTTRIQLFRGAFLGKLGVAGLVLATGYALSRLIRIIPGFDKAFNKAGAAAENFFSRTAGGKLLGLSDPFGGVKAPGQDTATKIRAQAAKLEAAGLTARQAADKIFAKHPNLAKHDVDVLAGVFGAKPHLPGEGSDSLSRFVVNAAASTKKVADKTKKVVADVVKNTPEITAAQKAALTKKRNGLFDALVDARLGRIDRLPLRGQLAALAKISAQLTARIAATKDVTRKLNLEDKLVDVKQQRKDVQKQIAENILSRRTAKQFRELGLTAAGEAITPGVGNLKKRLGSVSEAVKGSFLDTAKTKGVLSRIRKVLSEGLVPKDVRAKLKEMLDGLNDELKNHTNAQQTKFRHVSSNALLAGLGLSPEQLRKARARLAQVGAGGTIASGSQAFALAGGTTVVNLTATLDGKVVAKNTTKHQRKAATRRSGSRRGPYAGH